MNLGNEPRFTSRVSKRAELPDLGNIYWLYSAVELFYQTGKRRHPLRVDQVWPEIVCNRSTLVVYEYGRTSKTMLL
uniref:Uncharacterized protein n=1 Tax=Candidatus Kentrum eta TaxID=2126337 RepID=A0A450UMK7_9GAMM|nr:MAG: hypothetical protein BECKH772A_GA0070896_1006111 [Candidatus Kentron sp. H]VFJ94489.1 MAG: hypothetical protein BECKH772B_GA0070898_1006211 [Candidatus Kentron sp. H]VFK00989.1 MAG: hypothetical protein BECKH772C_GA0070978_1005611 [Candidatus Kentron sp. H]